MSVLTGISRRSPFAVAVMLAGAICACTSSGGREEESGIELALDESYDAIRNG